MPPTGTRPRRSPSPPPAAWCPPSPRPWPPGPASAPPRPPPPAAPITSPGPDAADAALRLATRHQLAWHELDALRAHATLDQAEHTDHGWAAQADALHARLVPPGLDPDPLATVERLVAAQKAAEKKPPAPARMEVLSDGGLVDQRADRHPGRGAR